MTSQIYKRFLQLYNEKRGKNASSIKMYKPFKEGFLHPTMYKKVFSKEEAIDPVTQAFVNYKKEIVMDTQEEEKLERLQNQREQMLGVVREGLDKLPQNGYSLNSKLRTIDDAEWDYREFREVLKEKRAGLKELDHLDEMINDFNYVMFHQHFFGEDNEFELAKADLWFNSPGIDMLF